MRAFVFCYACHMVKVAYIEVPPDAVDRYTRTFTPLYKTKNSSIRWTGALIPPRAKIKTSSKSLLPFISAYWNAQSAAVQAAWKAAAARQSYTGWNQFVSDTAYRVKFGLMSGNIDDYVVQHAGTALCGTYQDGAAVPSLLHGYKVGRIDIAAPADHFTLVQLHPVEYYRMKKVRGTKSQREPVVIREQLSLPFTVGLSYRANLTAVGAEPYARFYASVIVSYQGTDHIEEVGFNIPLVCDWERQEQTLLQVATFPRWYTLVIELHDVRGAIEFDITKSQHNGTNFARDFRDTNISAGFSDYNYQLPPSWEAEAAVTGASYGSVYPSDGSL